jgi:hypothetical protein
MIQTWFKPISKWTTVSQGTVDSLHGLANNHKYGKETFKGLPPATL